MGKFTADDFLSASTTINRPKRPARLARPVKQLRLPIAPPSPFFPGMNEVINTEPFPDFQEFNLNSVDQAEPPHCILHCHNDICSRLAKRRRDPPPCHCAFEPKIDVAPLPPPQPEFRFDSALLKDMHEYSASADLDHELAIHLSDTRTMLSHFQSHATVRALNDTTFMTAMQQVHPENPNALAISTTQRFFNIMHLYFTRTLQSKHRTLTIRQLRAELNVYMWTMLQEWVEAYCDNATVAETYARHPCEIAQVKASAAPGEVSKVWEQCVDEVVGLLVWRDEEVKQARIDRIVGWSWLGCLGLLVGVVVLL
jgi:hypothetical protein